MAGYGPAEMVQTPWGRADRLRERMLRPGPGMPREDVARSQRERLFAAAVAAVAGKGYEATTVADLLELSGVSRSAFYEHFRDKEDCVLATFAAVVEIVATALEQELSQDAPAEGRVRRSLALLFEAIAGQPATARLCFCDVYAVGERGRKAAEEAVERIAKAVGGTFAEIRGEKVPDDMIKAMLGGVQSVVQGKMRRNEESSLPAATDALCEWALGYELPGAPLRLSGRRVRPAADGRPPPFVAYSQAERIIRALAAGAGERGYPAVSIAEIAARASISQATFYSYFADKDSALEAALDSAGAQMLGVVLPAARRAPDWATAVRAAIGAICAFYAAEPDLARLVTVETYAAGDNALDLRDRAIGEIANLLQPGFEARPKLDPMIAQAALGAVWTLLYFRIVGGGPETLPPVAPLAAYMALAPFLGPEQAVEIANGDGRGPSAGRGPSTN
jgi:AcrR family transcriptional regulator